MSRAFTAFPRRRRGMLLHTLREPDAGVFFLLEEIEEADS